MTASTREVASRGEAYTPAVENVCNTISGRGEPSRSPTPNRQHAKRVERQTDDSSSTTRTTEQPKSIRNSPLGDGFVTHATSGLSDQEELKSLLLEGWGKGWLAFSRPDCACTLGPLKYTITDS